MTQYDSNPSTPRSQVTSAVPANPPPLFYKRSHVEARSTDAPALRNNKDRDSVRRRLF